ncbi:hypothetical protein AB0P07_02835 [Streptomyces sp. NPDC085944]|uniref:hypothetical protein n=1 Tax=Streptomyces sp. NPDC085944 TaxID=3154962 RepID=UPI0034429C30
MHLAHRRPALRCLAVSALSLVVLTGCGGESDGKAAATTAAPMASATPSAPAGETKNAAPASGDGTGSDGAASSTTGTASWAGTKKFVQIDGVRTGDGRTYLSVRPAEKEIHPKFDAWVITPGEGPFTEVPLAEDARVLLSVPLGDETKAAPYSQAEFADRLTAESPSARAAIGYDLSFDGQGQVIRLQSLPMP